MIEPVEEDILRICKQIRSSVDQIKNNGYSINKVIDGVKELEEFIIDKIGQRLAKKLLKDRELL